MTAPTGTAVAAPIIGCSRSSGNGGWRTRLRVRTGTSVRQPEGKIEPSHLLGNPIDVDRRDLWDVDRCAGLQHAANRAASVMGAVAGLIGLPCTGRGVAVADDGAGEWIGGRDARRPACADRCKNLHRQGNQDDWQKILQPAHRKSIRFRPNHQESPKSRSGSRNYVAALGKKPGGKRCVLQQLKGALPRYQASGVLQLNPQPSVANSQSFRRVLEF